MPSTIGVRHNEFLDKYYKTGKQIAINKEV